jgi:hypothetical protein
MPRPITVLPDAPLALLQYLRSQTIVTDLVPAERITTTISPAPTYPLIIVQRVGGNAVRKEFVDEPALQVSVFGGDQHLCSQVARTVRAAVLAIANDVVAEGVLVSGFEEVGPSWLPDTTVTPPLSRFVARYQVLLHP